MSQYRKPTGYFGKMLAKRMARAHKNFYKNTSKIMDLKLEDEYLEIGFGSGLFIKKYVSNITKIAGLDHSGEMVKLANEFNKNLVKSGKAEFKHGDVLNIPWGNNKFSIIVAIETFFFWSEPEKSLKEIYRVLKPGGRLIIEMAYNKDDGKNHAKLIKKIDFKLYSGNEMKKLLEDAGFSKIIIKYFQGFWIPIKGYIVPKGMILKAYKK